MLSNREELTFPFSFFERGGGTVVHGSAASRPIGLGVVSLSILAPISVLASHLMRRPASPRQMLARFGSSRRPCSTSWTCYCVCVFVFVFVCVCHL